MSEARNNFGIVSKASRNDPDFTEYEIDGDFGTVRGKPVSRWYGTFPNEEFAKIAMNAFREEYGW